MKTVIDPRVADDVASPLRIVGRGLAARALSPVAERHDDVVIFASGTGDSSCRDGVEFARERERLEVVLEQCRNADQRLVYCSSAGSVYGDATEARHERTPCRPTTPYGLHKLRCEALIRESDCRFLILRISNLIGPGANSRQLLPNLVQQVLSGRVRVFRHATRDLIGHEQFASIVEELLDHAAERDTVVLASGIAVPVPELAAEIQRVLQMNAEVEWVEAGGPQNFCVEKLRSLTPNSARFGCDDPWSVVRELIPKLADEYVSGRSRSSVTDERSRSWFCGSAGTHQNMSCGKGVS